MDFDFTDEQCQFRDALRRYLDKEYDFDARQKIVASDASVDAAHWRAFADFGMFALPVPQAQGGFDCGAVDMLVVMQELGRAHVVEPYWATAVGIEALRLGAMNDLLECAAHGELRLSVALNEPHARYELSDLRMTTRAHKRRLYARWREVDGSARCASPLLDRAGAYRRPNRTVSRRAAGAWCAGHRIPHHRRPACRAAHLPRHVLQAGAR